MCLLCSLYMEMLLEWICMFIWASIMKFNNHSFHEINFLLEAFRLFRRLWIIFISLWCKWIPPSIFIFISIPDKLCTTNEGMRSKKTFRSKVRENSFVMNIKSMAINFIASLICIRFSYIKGRQSFTVVFNKETIANLN